MHKKISMICAAAALAVGLGALPANAASTTFGGADYQNAQLSFSFGVGNDNNDRRGRFEHRGNNYYYNGHRGYHDRRPGYRYYNGFWFPQAAFSFGFSVGGDRGGSNWSRHVAWCEDHYRSYRASDNTFQPYHGPREECRSPYWR